MLRPKGIRVHVPKINDLHETKYKQPFLKDDTKANSDLEKAKPKDKEENNLFA